MKLVLFAQNSPTQLVARNFATAGPSLIFFSDSKALPCLVQQYTTIICHAMQDANTFYTTTIHNIQWIYETIGCNYMGNRCLVTCHLELSIPTIISSGHESRHVLPDEVICFHRPSARAWISRSHWAIVLGVKWECHPCKCPTPFFLVGESVIALFPMVSPFPDVCVYVL